MSHNKYLAFAQSFSFISLAKSPTDKDPKDQCASKFVYFSFCITVVVDYFKLLLQVL